MEKYKCPVCKEYEFEMANDFDICHVCFWENDGLQSENPNMTGGANLLSLNEYKQNWNKINTIVPTLIKKLKITKVYCCAEAKFHGLFVPREKLKYFINQMTENNIEIELDYYNICKIYNYNQMTFHGFPYSNKKTITERNNDMLNIVFTNDPIKTCKKYNLIELLEILRKSNDSIKTWIELMPTITIVENKR